MKNELKLKSKESALFIDFYDTDNSNEEVGRLHMENGQLKFTGNADEAAIIFFDAVCHIFNK